MRAHRDAGGRVAVKEKPILVRCVKPGTHAQAGQTGRVIKSSAMKISLNGELRQFPEPLTVTALVETLGYAGKRIAVERNGEIVPRGLHADVVLTDGDRIEIVVAVGGG